jgi:hypoxanthine-DNA glycosylase
MPHINSFAPIEDSTARILILGSIPGKKSLLAGQYYAHRCNSFWPIMGDLIAATPTLPYASRIQILKSNGIALWDVLASCTRDSSLDSDIDRTILSYSFQPIKILQIFFSTVRWLKSVFIRLCSACSRPNCYAISVFHQQVLQIHPCLTIKS